MKTKLKIVLSLALAAAIIFVAFGIHARKHIPIVCRRPAIHKRISFKPYVENFKYGDSFLWFDTSIENAKDVTLTRNGKRIGDVGKEMAPVLGKPTVSVEVVNAPPGRYRLEIKGAKGAVFLVDVDRRDRAGNPEASRPGEKINKKGIARIVVDRHRGNTWYGVLELTHKP